MSSEEAEKELGLVVDKMDKDHDKYISMEELHEWILQSFESVFNISNKMLYLKFCPFMNLFCE